MKTQTFENFQSFWCFIFFFKYKWTKVIYKIIFQWFIW